MFVAELAVFVDVLPVIEDGLRTVPAEVDEEELETIVPSVVDDPPPDPEVSADVEEAPAV